jgi:hypothetical protein
MYENHFTHFRPTSIFNALKIEVTVKSNNILLFKQA